MLSMLLNLSFSTQFILFQLYLSAIYREFSYDFSKYFISLSWMSFFFSPVNLFFLFTYFTGWFSAKMAIRSSNCAY